MEPDSDDDSLDMDAPWRNWTPSSGWSSDDSRDSFDEMHELVWHFAFDSQEWRPPWPPVRMWYEVPWCVRVYATQARLCSLLRVHGYSLLREFDQDEDTM